MNQERFARLREIVVAAIELDRHERTALLDDLCGTDAELRREAEGLLAQERQAGQRIDGLVPPVPRPERIGPYRIDAVLGEGGMGVVYRAAQEQPIRRIVALKVVRHGLDSAAIRARLESEREALTRLEHPNIARVLDAGADDVGRPYFAMELVRGISITEFCRSKGLAAKDRVVLFLDVARAVEHAHRRGVIHRDLKPSSVLVEEVQGRALPKVIDFGIAKLTEEPSLATAFRTRTGQVVGTLEYMSPEQARGDPHAADTRSEDGRSGEYGPDHRCLGCSCQQLQLRRLRCGHGHWKCS